MKLKAIKHVYFLGIGGIGMSALARYFKSLGATVNGYDRTPTALTDALQKEGIGVTFEDDLAAYPKEVDLVVYTPAIPKDHKGLNLYNNGQFQLLKRSEVLGLISADRFSICVAGSHGKTTVSSMIAHILASSGAGCTAFLGGIATNYNSNFIQQGDKYVVIEADEFDRSFHRLSPDMAVITAVDTDHLDIYGTKENIDKAFIEFVNKIDEEGFLVMKAGQSINDALPILDKAFYALNDTTADVYCSKYWVVEGGYIFNIMYFGKEYVGLRLNIGGFHNIENAIAAFTIAKELNISVDLIKAGIASFKGIKRRFEKVLSNEQFIFIDDYAHHPEEIRVFLESVKEMFPEQKITAVFQPHLFSRTKDLAEGFAKSLSTVDEVLLLDIYPARELPMEGVTSQLILDKVTAKKKAIVSKGDLLDHVRAMEQGVVLTIGAGDIDKLVEPIKEILASK